MAAKRRARTNGRVRSDETEAAAREAHPKSDASSIALLMVLYTLQGVPMGLSGAVPLLLAGRVGYKEQALFSIASLPFSLKLLWAPFVDAAYVPRWGRRKTWLVPTQFALGAAMVLSRPYISSWMGAHGVTPNIEALTALFFCLYFLCATQDIAVDGWALTMLSEANVGWASTCNSVGQSLGYALSYVGFVALHDEGTCNKYFRSSPKHGGLVSLASFVAWCGWAFLATTVCLAIFKREEGGEEAAGGSTGGAYSALAELKTAYGQAARTLRLAPVKALCLVLLTCKAAFGAADAAASLKAIEYGMPKEDIALLSPLLLAASIAIPLAVARWTNGPRPLSYFVLAVPMRLLVNPATWALLEFIKRAYAPTAQPGDARLAFALFAALSLFKEVASNLMFVSQMSFFARIADPEFGGTYMTLLNTIANLGGKWPPSLALYFVEQLDSPKLDGFSLELAVCTLLGLLWLAFFAPRILRLQRVPLAQWRASPAGSPKARA